MMNVKISISKNGFFVGGGVWTGQQIEDCPVDLGDRVYEAIEDDVIKRTVAGAITGMVELSEDRYEWFVKDELIEAGEIEV